MAIQESLGPCSTNWMKWRQALQQYLDSGCIHDRFWVRVGWTYHRLIDILFTSKKGDFEKKQGSPAKRVFIKIRSGGHTGRRIYAHPHRKIYELLELLSQPQALSLDLTSSLPWQSDHPHSLLRKESVHFHKLQSLICILAQPTALQSLFYVADLSEKYSCNLLPLLLCLSLASSETV